MAGAIPIRLDAYNVNGVIIGHAAPRSNGKWACYIDRTWTEAEDRDVAEAWFRSKGAETIVERWFGR